MLIIRFKNTEELSELLNKLDGNGWEGPKDEGGQPWHYRSKTMDSYTFQGAASGDGNNIVYCFDTLLVKNPKKNEAEKFLKEYLEKINFNVEQHKI